MQGYVPARDEAFGESRKCFRELEQWAASEEAAGLQHADLEEQLEARGRELLRRLFQDRLERSSLRPRSGVMTWLGRTAWSARGRRKAGPGRW